MAYFQTKNSNSGEILEDLAMGRFWHTFGHLVYLVAIWYILWLGGIFLPVLVCCIKKNLATLMRSLFSFFWEP
jgi:hypothetical protein